MKAGTKRPREIVNPMSGVREAPITRLMSPGDLGERLKPFVFLDQISVPGGAEQRGRVRLASRCRYRIVKFDVLIGLRAAVKSTGN